jgi:hypothetical protein
MSEYLDFVMQIQSLGTDAFAQICFDGQISPIVRLPSLGDMLLEEGSMAQALFRFIFPDYAADQHALPSEQSLRQPRTRLRQAMREAHARGKRIRIRLQANDTHEPASQKELEQFGLFKKQQDSDEASLGEIKTKINWVSILPWELLLHGLWLALPKDPISGKEEQWWEWVEQGPSLVRALPPGSHPSGQNKADEKPNPVMQVLLAWADPNVESAEGCRLFSDTVGERNVQWIEEQFSKSGPESEQAYEIHPPLSPVTCEKLKDYLEANKVDVLHLLTHGDLDKDERVGYARLFFEDADGKPDPVTGSRLLGILDNGKQVPQVVFLHACQSATTTLNLQQGVAQCLINGGVKYVVAMQDVVNQGNAARFARTFYAALAERVSIDQAMSRARAKLVGQKRKSACPTNPLLERVKGPISLPAWAVPVLFMHNEADGWLEQGKLPKAIRCLCDGKVMLLIESPEGHFYVDKYPVTAAQYKAYIQKTDAPKWKNVWSEVGGSEAGSFPVTNLSLQDAKGYACRMGKKDLPTLAQWRWAAAGGGTIKAYPWGGEFEEGRCNSLEYWEQKGLLKPTSVTEFPPQNGVGVCDIVGNIAEIARDGESWVYCGGRYRDPQEKVIVNRPSPPRFSGPFWGVGFRCVATVTRYVRWLADDQVEEVTQDARDAPCFNCHCQTTAEIVANDR